MFNTVIHKTLDAAFRKWLTIKYNLQAIDEEGRGVYEVHPDDWEAGDYEAIVAFSEWSSRPHKSNEELREWLRIAEARGVDMTAFEHVMKKDKDAEQEGEVPWTKMAVVAGATLGLAWLLQPPKMHAPPPPLVNDEEVNKLAAMFSGDVDAFRNL